MKLKSHRYSHLNQNSGSVSANTSANAGTNAVCDVMLLFSPPQMTDYDPVCAAHRLKKSQVILKQVQLYQFLVVLKTNSRRKISVIGKRFAWIGFVRLLIRCGLDRTKCPSSGAGLRNVVYNMPSL